MKKFYFMAFIATAALTMTSCSNDDIAGTGTEISKNETAQAINFSTYLGRTPQSRGVVTDDNAINKSGFGVYAAYTKTSWGNESPLNFMFNQHVTKNTKDDTWEYTPIKYWPAVPTELISFFAYAPYDRGTNITLDTENNSTGAPVITVNLTESTLGDTPDFVTACAMNKSQSTVTDNKVSFNLQHIMTRIAIEAVPDRTVYEDNKDENKTKVVVTGFELTSTDALSTKSTYTFPSASDSKGTWKNEDGASYTLNLKNILNSNSTEITGASVTGTVLTNETAQSLFNNNIEYLYLIPANNGEGLSSDGNVQAKITYAIVTEDSKLANGSVTTTATKTVDIPTSTLKQGESYKLTFKIGLNKVVLNAETMNWNKDSQAPIPVTGADTNN